MIKYCLFIMCISLISGCVLDDCQDTSEAISELKYNRNLWNSFEFTSYNFSYSAYSSGCSGGGGSPYPAVLITVTNNEVSSVYNPSYDKYEDISMFDYTIDKVFEMIENRLTGCVMKYDITYNEQFGFPQRINIYSSDCDESFNYMISDFQ